MPINFELTFTQPLLSQLDLGTVGNSDALSRAITNAYVRTMLTGLPGAGTVPPVLPAPGLGSPPPPFPIPSIPINAFQNRQLTMQRILRNYFELREKLGLQGDILETIKAISALVRKARYLKREINRIARDIRNIVKQIAELPKTLEQIKSVIITIIKEEQARIEELYRGLDGFRLQLSAADFQLKFQRELSLLNTIQSFRVTLSLSDIDRLTAILTEAELLGQSVPDFNTTNESTAEKQIKLYIARQISQSLNVIITLSNSVVAPEKYLSYYDDLARIDARFTPVYQLINNYVFLKRSLQNQLVKLNQKRDDHITKLRSDVEVKINEAKTKLSQRQKELAQKKKSKGKSEQFLKAAKTINETKKKYLTAIRKTKRKLRLTKSIILRIQTIVQDVSLLKKEIELTYQADISQFLKQLVNVPTSVVVGGSVANITGTEEIQQDLINYLNEAGIRDRNIQSIILAQVVGKIPSPYPLIQFLEEKSNRYLSVFNRVLNIEYNLEGIDNDITELLTGQTKQTLRKAGGLQEPTFLELLNYVFVKINNFIIKLQIKINNLFLEVNQKIETTTSKFINDVKDQAILLVPIKSDIADPKNKAAILKAKRDKINYTKKVISKHIKQQTLLVRGFKASTRLLINIANGQVLYSQNSGNINTLFDSWSGFKLLESPQNAQAIQQENQRLKQDVYDYYYGTELLVGFIVELVDYFKRPDLLRDIEYYIQSATDAIVVAQYREFYNKLKELILIGNNPLEIIAWLNPANLRIFESAYVETMLIELEEAYMAPLRIKYNELSMNPLIMRVAPLKPYQESMLGRISQAIIKLIQQLRAFIDDKIYKKLIKPPLDKVRAKIEEVKRGLRQELRKLEQRRVNVDAALMSVAFDLATRAFWSGFSWITANGVRYTCVSIGPFVPIKATADGGSSEMIRQIAKSMNIQLITMNGIVSPPPPTGIPPFPYVSYQ